MDLETAYCPMCDHENEPMGALGFKIHYRCRDCGFEYSETIEEENHESA